MSEEGKTEHDPNEEHDDEVAKGKDHVSANLTEAGNKPPPAPESFKITHSG